MKKIIFALCFIVTVHVSQAQILYGTAAHSGYYSRGTVCKLDITTNSLTVVHNFNLSDGTTPRGTLVRSFNGNLYGRTRYGGSNDYGIIYSYDPVSSTFTKLKDFNYSDGYESWGSLVEASNGVIYGMGTAGGSYGVGTIYSFYPNSSTLTKIKDLMARMELRHTAVLYRHQWKFIWNDCLWGCQ